MNRADTIVQEIYYEFIVDSDDFEYQTRGFTLYDVFENSMRLMLAIVLLLKDKDR